MIAKTLETPYYAVIFTSVKSDIDEGYSSMSEKMMELAHKQEGFLGVESARNEVGITVSYWENLQSIKKWRENSEHTIARETGRKLWYESFTVRIALVEKEYSFYK